MSIKIHPPRPLGLGARGSQKRALVEFPFTEVRPSLDSPRLAVYEQCKALLKDLSPRSQAAVLANLCVTFGETRRG